MDTNRSFIQLDIENKKQPKWWHHRWIKIGGISFTVLIILAISLSMLLNFVTLAPKSYSTITTTTQPPGEF